MDAIKSAVLAVIAFFVFGILMAISAFCAEPPHAVAQNTSRKLEAQRIFTENTLIGLKKGFALNGRTFPVEKEGRIREIISVAGEQIVDRAVKDGVFDDYYKQLKDPEALKLNEATINATSKEEARQILDKHLTLIKTKYPRLWRWADGNSEVNEITRTMMLRLSIEL